ncbi:MAG: endolytic transglycosylase MltG [Chitinophagaceae bacterium]
MKRILLIVAFAIIVVGGFAAYNIFGPTVKAPKGKYFYIHTGSNYDLVVNNLIKQNIIPRSTWFNIVSRQLLKYNNIKPGKYEIKKGMSIFNLVRMLRNGRQTPVNFVIVKYRTKEDFARRVEKDFETDSTAMMAFLNNEDSLHNYGLDSNTWMTAIIPNTYSYKWNSTPTVIFSKLYGESKKFWTDERLQKAQALGLTPRQVYILASIVEEETSLKSDKGKIASVYINRIKKGMPLQADPTVKFAMKDFGLKRIWYKHLDYPSPYNTYTNAGLPPGPICTPSVETIDEVLNSPQTDYYYFVANSDFSGSHIFTSSYEEHKKYAKLFAEAQNKQDSIRRAKQNSNP